MKQTSPAKERALDESEVLEEVKQALRSIKYGCVQIVLHDSKVVQIEKTEKIRMAGNSQ